MIPTEMMEMWLDCHEDRDLLLGVTGGSTGRKLLLALLNNNMHYLWLVHILETFVGGDI